MKRFGAHSLGILQGSRVLFADFADGGPMWTGQGDRESRHLIKFKDSFKEPPMVHVSLSMWDIDSRQNSRADITAENITKDGFHLVFRTWADTRIARVRADWMAMGAVQDEEQWDVD